MNIGAISGILPLETTNGASTGAGSATGATSGTGSSTTTSSANNLTSQLQNPQMFLQLLVAELQNQNPDNPANPSTILAQTSQLAQMESITTQTKSITTEQYAVQDTEATGLVGRTVTATVNGSQVSGPVSDVQLSANGAPTLVVNGSSIPLADVTDVTAPAAAATGTGATG